MFRVRWKQSALNELASLWIVADTQQRRAFTQAAALIDTQLQIDSDNQGESRSDNRRIFFSHHLWESSFESSRNMLLYAC